MTSNEVFEKWYNSLSSDVQVNDEDMFTSAGEAADFIRDHKLVETTPEGYYGFIGLVSDIPEDVLASMKNIWNWEWPMENISFSEACKLEFFEISSTNELLHLCGVANLVDPCDMGLLNWQVVGYEV